MIICSRLLSTQMPKCMTESGYSRYFSTLFGLITIDASSLKGTTLRNYMIWEIKSPKKRRLIQKRKRKRKRKKEKRLCLFQLSITVKILASRTKRAHSVCYHLKVKQIRMNLPSIVNRHKLRQNMVIVQQKTSI